MLLNRAKANSVFHVDLERPDVVEEWGTGTHAVSQLYQKSKFNQMSSDKQILALNEQGEGERDVSTPLLLLLYISFN